MSENPQKLLIIAGGGTGGHVLAGVALAHVWKAKYGPVVFVGARGGMEEKLVPREGFELRLLKTGSLRGVSLLKKIKTYLQLPVAILYSIYLLFRLRPTAVIGVGGYASGPFVLVARICSWLGSIQTAVLEQNVVPGITNRFLGRWVHQVFAAFPGTDKSFPPGKVLITGNPIRSQLVRMPSAIRDPFTLFIFGGSQGALGINSLILGVLPQLSDLLGKIRFIHQTGERDYDRVVRGHADAKSDARVEKFVYDMAGAYSVASLVICRSGSSTLAELAAVGRAAILIPFPLASDNHQEANARLFSDAGAASLMLQGLTTPEQLALKIRGYYENPSQLDSMEEQASRFYHAHAAEEILSQMSRALR